MAEDILIVVNCETKAIQMFCDPSIYHDNGEGSPELGVRVPAGTELRWRVVPLQLSQGPSMAAGVYHTIITAYGLYPDASTYLTEWGTSNGAGDAPYYSQPGNLGSNSAPLPVPAATSAAISVEGINRPFVQCLTQLANRDQQEGPRVAYTFEVAIYKDGTKVDRVTWDPYVIVFRP